jgi:PAS domain S-box-containing protein
MEQGGTVRLEATVRDITDRKRAEEAAQRRERRFRALIEQSQDLVSINDRDGTYLYVNPAHEAVCGFKPDELVGRNAFDLLHPDDVQRLVPVLAEALQTSVREATVEYRLRHKDGSWHAFEGMGLNLLDDPDVAGILITGRDITARKRAEAEQAALFEIAKDVAGVVDLNEILKRVHQRVATLLPCDRIVTYYWDATRNTYRALAWHGVPSRLVPDGVALEFHSGQPVAERLLGGETVLINDIADQSLVPLEMLTHFGITAVLVVPLAVRGRRMGALAAHNSESGRRFDPHQVRLFEGIAQQVSVALEAADLYRAQEEETAIAGALARVGQELISSLSSPALLDRLCQLTTEALGCDHSYTWLWHASDEAFVPVASYGDSPEQWDMMRLVKLGRSALATQLDGMERNGVFDFKVADLPDSEAKVLAHAFGVTVSLMVPLRRGGELVGVQTAGYRGREGVFGERHERIARGIGQLASLALENVRLIEELQRANRLKSDFMATMSHELRTPLNIIMGYNGLLLEEVFGPLGPEQVDALRRTEKSAEDLLALITATLDIGRVEAGKVLLDVQEIDLGELHREIAGETTSPRETPPVPVVWEVAPELPRLHTDRAKLKVVVKNLLANAVKFTGEGQVTVRAGACDGGVEISVTDTGIGIGPEVLPIIFEPFRQGESVLTRRHGGAGLGLYIVRRYLDLLGGTIRVESELGCGSTFRVWLPSGAPGAIP